MIRNVDNGLHTWTPECIISKRYGSEKNMPSPWFPRDFWRHVLSLTQSWPWEVTCPVRHYLYLVSWTDEAVNRAVGEQGSRFFRWSSFIMALALLLLCLIPAAAFAVEDAKTVSAQAPFDYFMFAQQWPGTYCESSGTCCQSLTYPVEFTIHGVWPNYDNGAWPSCCEGGAPWDPTVLEPLLPELQKHWPTLSCSNTTLCFSKEKGSFWQHEWEKHGTCASPVIRDVYTYFDIGLELHKKYQLTKILNKAGFVPDSSDKYKTSDVVKAVTDYVGAVPELTCSSGQILEIRICFYKDFTPRDCGVLSASPVHDENLQSSSCSTQILIPQFVYSSGGWFSE